MTFEPSALCVPIGVAAIAAAGVAILLRRFDRAIVRVAGACVVVLAVLVSFDWPRRVREELPAQLVVASDAPADAAWRADLADRARAAHATLRFVEGPLDVAALVAAVRADDGAVSAIVHAGSFDAARAIPLRAVVDGAFLTAASWPFDADDLQLSLRGSAQRDRPLAVELRLSARARAALQAGAHAELTLRAADGHELAHVAQAVTDGIIAVECVPTASGTLSVELDLAPGDAARMLRWEGHVAVGQGQQVLLLGARSDTLVHALQAQGVRAERIDSLPAELDPRAVVVALAAVPAADALRLQRFVDDGGGLLLVGAEGGGALPRESDALAALSPLPRLPDPPPIVPPSDQGTAPTRQAVDAPPEALPTPPSKAPGEDVSGTLAGQSQQQSTERDAVVERRAVAMVLVVDCSGSMSLPVGGVGGRAKIELARASARATADLLEAGDELGVIGFGIETRTILPFAPLPGAAALEQAMARMDAVDPDTLIGGAMKRAEEWIKDCKAPVRHVVVITDGELQDPVDAALGQSVARRLGESGVQVSAILVVPDGEFTRADRLHRITELGRGRFVQEAKGDSIPRFVADVTTTALRAAGRRPGPASDAPPKPPDPEPEKPPKPPEPEPTPPPPVPVPPSLPQPIEVLVVEDSPLLRASGAAGFPPLFGITRVVAAENATVLLATREGTPLFAWRHFGLGRVAAFASDLDGPWSSKWREDPAFPARLATFVTALRPASTEAGTSLAPDAVHLLPEGARAAEVDWLVRAARAGRTQPVAALEIPQRRSREVVQGQAQDHALALIAALVGLAVLEALMRRRA
ncbi:MAG: VWA domain-containing protein [Planctomycetota bacterium]